MKKFAKILLVAMSLNLVMSAAFAEPKTGESASLDCPTASTRTNATGNGTSTETKEVTASDATKGN